MNDYRVSCEVIVGVVASARGEADTDVANAAHASVAVASSAADAVDDRQDLWRQREDTRTVFAKKMNLKCSDHDVVCMTICNEHATPRGYGYWRLDTALLERPSVITELRDVIQKYTDEFGAIETTAACAEAPAAHWWLRLKQRVRGCLQRRQRLERGRERRQVQQARARVRRVLERCRAADSATATTAPVVPVMAAATATTAAADVASRITSENLMHDLVIAASKLASIELLVAARQAQSARKRAAKHVPIAVTAAPRNDHNSDDHDDLLALNDVSDRVLFETPAAMQPPRQSAASAKSVEQESRKRVLQQASRHYAELFGAPRPPESDADAARHEFCRNELWSAAARSRLSNDETNACEGKLSAAELMAAMKRMQNRRAPGPDGLPIEFYRALPELVDMLLTVYNEASVTGALPAAMQEGAVTLLYKQKAIRERWRTGAHCRC